MSNSPSQSENRKVPPACLQNKTENRPLSSKRNMSDFTDNKTPISYQFIRSRRKTLGMEIRDGQLIVRAPLRCTKTEADRFVHSHRSWVEKHLAKSRAVEAQIQSMGMLTEEEIRRLADEAARVILERVRYYAPLIGVRYGRITIRCQRTRWGSCSSKGNLNFNCLLMLTPPEVLDSVVVHELCHRKEMNHSQAFYKEVLRVYPSYHTWNRWLKQNGAAILKRVP